MSPLTQVNASGPVSALTTPYVPSTFYRVRAQDLDSDGDGMSDWAGRSQSDSIHTAPKAAARSTPMGAPSQIPGVRLQWIRQGKRRDHRRFGK